MSNTKPTPQQAMADAIASGAVQAWAYGKPIEYKHYSSGDWMPLEQPAQPWFTSNEFSWRPCGVQEGGE